MRMLMMAGRMFVGMPVLRMALGAAYLSLLSRAADSRRFRQRVNARMPQQSNSTPDDQQ